MSSINAPGSHRAYQRLSTQQTSATRQASAAQRASAPAPGATTRASQPAAPAEAASASQAPASQEAGDLTASERKMIAQQFPETPGLSMRLYGPGRDAQTVRPDAVGSRLDVQG